jgi:tetratricopeptide (TPR) repeat protein
MKVLVALARANGGVVSRGELIAACWEGRVVSDDAIHRAVSQLRRFGAGFGADAFQVETVPRVGFRLIQPTDLQPPRDRASRLRPWALVGALVVMVAVAGTWVALLSAARPRALVVDQLTASASDQPAIAVRDGLSGDLARALAGNPARVTVVRASDARSDARAELRLSGTVATLSPSLQAHVQLSAARSGAILWADNFQGDPAHADALRQTMAHKIDSVINCALSSRNTSGAPIGDETSRLYLEACDLIEQFRLEEALPRLRRVTASAPNFARAWADLATTETFTTDSLDPAGRAATYAAAREHARHALQLDPKTGLAYYALARAMPGIGDWQARVDIVTRGLRVDPDSSELNNEMGYLLLDVGRVHDALPYFRRAKDLDPINPSKTASAISAVGYGGSAPEADALIDHALVLWPDVPLLWRTAIAFDARSGDMARAEAMLTNPNRDLDIDPGFIRHWQLWLAYRRARTPATAGRYAAEVLNSRPASAEGDTLPTALELAAVGKTDQAYALAFKGAQDVDADNNSVLFRDYLAPFRADPRFMTLAAQRGLLQIWRRTNQWPDFCSNLATYDCKTTFPHSH